MSILRSARSCLRERAHVQQRLELTRLLAFVVGYESETERQRMRSPCSNRANSPSWNWVDVQTVEDKE
jgi:hypothetical protein